MDELRTEIWDLLYRAQEPQSVEQIAESLGADAEGIREAVNHEWFTVSDGLVSISQPAQTEQ